VLVLSLPVLASTGCGFPSLSEGNDSGVGPDRTVARDRQPDDAGPEDLAVDAGSDPASERPTTDVPADVLDGSAGTDASPDGMTEPDLAQGVDSIGSDGSGMGDMARLDLSGCPAAVSVGDNGDDDLPGVTLDTFITEDSPTEVQRVTHQAQINVDGNNGGRRHGLMRFELMALAGCVVTGATLEVTIPMDKSDGPYAIHEVKQAWDEKATWLVATPGHDWNPAGCTGTPCLDAAFQAASFSLVGVNSNPLDKTVVQRWIDDPTSNLGILIRLQSGDDGMIFRSTRGTDGTRPRLKLSLAPGTGG
jgi:hypothetical protein